MENTVTKRTQSAATNGQRPRSNPLKVYLDKNSFKELSSKELCMISNENNYYITDEFDSANHRVLYIVNDREK